MVLNWSALNAELSSSVIFTTEPEVGVRDLGLELVGVRIGVRVIVGARVRARLTWCGLHDCDWNFITHWEPTTFVLFRVRIRVQGLRLG